MIGNKQKKGFTLVEIMLVITIIAILFVVLVPRFGFATDKAKETGVQSDFRAFQTAAESVINEKSFKRIDDGNVNEYLNEYLDKVYEFTDNVSAKENPWGYNYRLALLKDVNDEGSGTLEFISIKGFNETSTYRTSGEDFSTASGSKLVISVYNGVINSEVIDFENGDTSLIPGDKTPIRIEISKLPKTTFVVGDSFTYSGLEVKVIQADGTSRVTTDYTISQPTMTVGTHVVTIQLNENTSLTTQYSITVKNQSTNPGGDNTGGDNTGGDNTGGDNTQEKALLTISITSMPSKLQYQTGETLNISGLVITAYFNDGSTMNVTSSCSYSSTLSKGQTSVRFTYSYSGKTCTVDLFGLSVTDTGDIDSNEKVVSTLTIKNNPIKMSYIDGELFDKTGMVIEVKYNDNTTKDVTNMCVYNSSLLVGQTSIIFNYTENGKTVSAVLSGLSVIKQSDDSDTDNKTLQSISISGSYKTMYNAGENFDTTGLVVTAHFSDGTTSDVSSMITHDGYNLQPLKSYITVFYDYGGIRKSNTINITVKKALVSLSLESQPSKTVGYIEGDNVDTTGMRILAYFSDNTTVDVTNQVVLTNHQGLKVGWTTVTATYTYNEVSKKVTFSVYAEERTEPVPAKLVSIAITKLPDKLKYWEGDVFDESGIEVTAYFDNETSQIVSGYYFSNHTDLTAGTRSIMVTYSKDDIVVNTTFEIIIESKPAEEFIRLGVEKAPTKTVYLKGETFDPTGMVVRGYYDDILGLSPVVIPLENLNFTNTTIQEDGQFVYIEYIRSDMKKITYPYTVNMAGELVDLKVTKQPNKLEYVVGETFDPTGMELTAIFADGSTDIVEPYSYTTDVLDKNDKTVSVSYGFNNKYLNVEIEIVVKSEVKSIEITTQPNKLKYRVGSDFDSSGMVVTATYQDNSTEDVTDKIQVVNGTDLQKETSEIIIKYTWVDKSVSATVEISVVDTITKAIASGVDTMFFIDDTDTLYAMGNNNVGQLGTGDTSNVYAPKEVKVDLVKQIIPSLTQGYTMFLRADGTVYASGYNGKGQLGVGDTSNKSTPVKVSIDEQVKKIVVGTNHTLFLTVDNSLYACGDNTYGQLGLSGTSQVRTTPERVTGINDIVDIAAAGNHSFVITGNGRVYAFGENSNGQLGMNNTATQYNPYPVDNALMGSVVEVYTAPTHTIFKSEDGSYFVTGKNQYYELLLGDTTARQSPTYCATLTDLQPSEVIVRNGNTLIILEDKSIKGIGLNTNGELINGGTSNLTKLTDVTEPDYVEIAFGSRNSICSTKSLEIQTYGYNNVGQLGIGDTTNANKFSWNYLFNARDMKKVLTGTQQIWVKDGHDVIWTGGNNSYGQLADGTTTTTGRYLSMNTNSTLNSKFDSISYVVKNNTGSTSTTYGTLFVMDDGTLWASGYNSSYYGSLGIGSSNVTSLTQVGGMNGKVAKVKHFNRVTTVLTDTGYLYTMGDAQYVGDNGTGTTTTPRQLTNNIVDFDVFAYTNTSYSNSSRITTSNTLYGSQYNTNYALGNSYSGNNYNYSCSQSTVSKTYSGPSFTMIIKEDNSVWATGYNGYGLFGTGDTNTLTNFTRVLEPSYNVTDLYFSGNLFSGNTDYYRCVYALTSEGDVYVAGAGTNGELGLGNTNNVYSFTKLSGISNVSKIVTGQYRAFFITDSGIYATGDNNQGECGVGTTSNLLEPTLVAIDAENVVDIHAYQDHTVFEMSDGTIRVCGVTSNGYIGNSNLNVISAPTALFEYSMADVDLVA